MRDINTTIGTMISKIRGVENTKTLNSMNRLDDIVNVIIAHNSLNLMNKMMTNHNDSEGNKSFSLIYVFDDSHLTIKTFPDSDSIILHLFFHKNFDHRDCYQIHNFLLEALVASLSLSAVEFTDIETF